MIFTRDFVTRENYWQIASLVTQKSLFTVTHALFFISLITITTLTESCPNLYPGLCVLVGGSVVPWPAVFRDHLVYVPNQWETMLQSNVVFHWLGAYHYRDVIMGTMASQITSLIIVYSTIYSGADQRKHQSWASLAFVQGIHWWPVNSQHKWPVTWKMFPFDDVIIYKMVPVHGYWWPSKDPVCITNPTF